jgi:riboflavin synthase alpha subunit
MASFVSVDHGSSYVGATSPTTDTGITVPSGTNRKCIVFVGGEENEANPSVDTVTLGGNSLTKIAELSDGSASFHNYISAFYLNDANFPSSGTQTLSMSFSGVDPTDNHWDYFAWVIYFFDDADQGSITSSEYDTQFGSSTASITFSPGVSVSNGDYVCLSGNVSSGATFTCSGYTEDVDASMGGAAYYAYSKAITSSGTETPTPTANASETRFTGFMVNVLDYSAGGTNVSATTDALIITEQAATVNAETNVSATTDALIITEQAATVNAETNALATTDTLVISEQTADVNLNRSVSATSVTLTITEQNATIDTGGGNTNVSATTDALIITEQAATVNAETNVSATTDNLLISEQTADVNLNRSIAVNSATLTISEQNPTVNAAISIAVTTDSLVISPLNVSIDSGAALVAQLKAYSHEKAIRVYSHEKAIRVYSHEKNMVIHG